MADLFVLHRGVNIHLIYYLYSLVSEEADCLARRVTSKTCSTVGSLLGLLLFTEGYLVVERSIKNFYKIDRVGEGPAENTHIKLSEKAFYFSYFRLKSCF